MSKKIKEFLEKNGLKLSPTSKASNLLAKGKDDAEVAVAMQTTKAYKENRELRELCISIVAKAATKQAESNHREERTSFSSKGGENERNW